MAKSLFMEYTEVPAYRSIAEIQHMLTQAGAVAINQRMQDKRVTGIGFTLPFNGSLLNFELPARVETVFGNLIMQRKRPPDETAKQELRAKAENITWRQLSKWVEAQLAIVGVGLVQAREVFMPYHLGADGRTLFEHWQGRLLEAPKEN